MPGPSPVRGWFLRDRRGVSSIEFAFMAPVVAMLLLVGVDTARYIAATQRLESVAATIGQMISVNQSGSVTYSNLQFYHDSAMVIFPDVLADSSQQKVTWSSDIGISMASLQFTAASGCGSNCSVTPKMLWSGGSNPRSCKVTPTASADTDLPSPTTLPADVFQAGSLLVVDVTYNFRPTIAPKFLRTLPIARSYYVSPRYVAAVNYSVVTGDNGIAKPC